MIRLGPIVLMSACEHLELLCDQIMLSARLRDMQVAVQAADDVYRELLNPDQLALMQAYCDLAVRCDQLEGAQL